MSDESSLRDTSVVVAAWQQLSVFLSRAVRASGLAILGTILTSWARTSFLYRWLTAEPEPDVITIDLRETYTVGPILALLDRVFGTLGRAWQSASVGAMTDSTRDALREQPIRTLSVVALAALLTNLGISAVFGTLGTTGLAVHLTGVTIAALGTQIRVSWAQCTESVTYRYLVAALEPPEPPESNDSERQ
jgi:uncharacterized BrkB/YihY/UPF0761 family membrane protein